MLGDPLEARFRRARSRLARAAALANQGPAGGRNAPHNPSQQGVGSPPTYPGEQGGIPTPFDCMVGGKSTHSVGWDLPLYLGGGVPPQTIQDSPWNPQSGGSSQLRQVRRSDATAFLQKRSRDHWPVSAPQGPSEEGPHWGCSGGRDPQNFDSRKPDRCQE